MGARLNPATDGDGRLSPWANPVTGALGWQVTTPSRRLAATVAAISGGKARLHEKGQWQVRIRESGITVTVTGAHAGTLWCRLDKQPDPGALTVAYAPWTIATVLKCPVTTLPARGTLSVRDIRITTRMGRTIRYLVPEFMPLLEKNQAAERDLPGGLHGSSADGRSDYVADQDQ